MLNILLMIILIIILIIFIILILGIRITLEFEKKDSKIKGCLKILILKYVKVYSKNLFRDDDEEEEEDEEEDKAPKDGKKLFELIKPCLNDLKSFLKKALNSINVNKFETHLVIGFSNFARTGEYIGYIWAILSVLSTTIPNSQLTAYPSFTGSKLDLKGNIVIDIKIITLIIPTIQLLLKPEIRALIDGVRNG